MDKTIKITFIKNSGFHIETKHRQFVIDYYDGDLPVIPGKPTTFIATHSHGDHYHEKIFDYRNEDVNYILSEEIDYADEDDITWIKPYEVYDFDDYSIRTFGSTDEGVSLILTEKDWDILHMGDLNWWHWEEDSEEKQREEERAFKEEVDKIAEYDIDVAMAPVDPRLGEAACWGGEYVLEKICPKYFMPMHLHEDWQLAADFVEKNDNEDCFIFTVERHGDEWIILA